MNFHHEKTRFNSRAAGRHYYDVNVSLIFSPARIPTALCTWFCIVFWLGSVRHGHDTSLCVSVRHNSRDLIRGGRIRSVPLSLASRSRCVPRYRRQLFPLRCHATTHSRSTLLLYSLCTPCAWARVCLSKLHCCRLGSLCIVRDFWIPLFEVRLYNVIDNDDIKGTVPTFIQLVYEWDALQVFGIIPMLTYESKEEGYCRGGFTNVKSFLGTSGWTSLPKHHRAVQRE